MLLFGYCFHKRHWESNKRQHVFKKSMSGGLMSCVRENSPPLEMDINVSGPLSLPEPSINNSDLMGSLHSSSHHNIMSSTPLAAQSSSHLDVVGSSGGTPLATPPNTEQTKRRRFHPLRNLRRIFRRRTITSPPSAAGETPTSTLTGPAASSNSEKNLRSATLGATSVVSVASASSPSSPLTHQQLQDAYLTQSLPKSKSAYSSLLGGKKYHQSHDYNLNGGGGGNETKSKSKHKHKNHHKQQQHQQSKEFEQQHQQQQQQSEDMFGTTTQTSASYHHVQHHTSSTTATSGTSASTKSSLLSQRQSMGVAVFPAAMNRSFFTERQKLRSVGDSSQDLDSGSGNDSGTGGGHNTSAGDRTKSGGGGSASGGEMSDSQRSLSEGRLVDSDYSRDGLSQSHDSVFSESATASSLSIVLKAELADVLRKRRNRPDASDEDLGLPRSPASPQRRAGHGTTAATASAVPSTNTKSTTGEKYTEISSVSLLSMNSTDGEDAAMATSTANNSTASNDVVQERTTATRYSRSSTMSSISMTNDILRHRDSSFADVKDEVDLFSSDWQRLSHSAAKHKMAIRPIKKKGGPSRQHRRTLETSIPEANEDLNRFVNKQILEVKDLDIKAKTRSLPPSVNAAKLMDEQKQAINVKNTATSSNTTTTKESVTKTTKIINTTTSSTTTSTTNLTTTNLFGLRNLTAKASAMFESKDSNAITERKEEEMTKKPEELPPKTQLTDKSVVQPMETTETGFLRRLMHRNSKRSIAKANAGEEQDQDELDKKQNEPKKLQMSTNTTVTQSAVSEEKSKSEFIIHESKVEEKRKEIKRELYNESKTVGLTSMVNNFTMPSKEEKKLEDKLSPSKPKSGPAARQRYLPQNISNEDLMKLNEEKPPTKESKISKTSLNETFQSTSIIREITKQQSSISNSATKVEHHFEKKPKIVGLSAFQQKISRSNDSFARNNSNNSLISLDKSEEDLTSTPLRLSSYEQKQRKSVEKSRSFRAYGEQKDLSPNGVHNNMPSLPDLSLNLRVPYCRDFILNDKEYSSPSPPEPLDEKHASLGFEINDNKLVKPEREIRKSFGNYDKNIIMTTSTGITPSKTTPTKLLTPGNVVSTFSTSSSSSASTCNKNISEIENNIDLIVKSPFVSVIRKSINLSEDQAEEVVKMSAPKVATEKVRPTVLNLKKEQPFKDEFNLDTPSTASVTLREKAMVKTNTLFISNLENSKELERKSAPANNSATKSNGFRANSTRRSSSVVESIEDKPKSLVPEFMKIQLNRVDATRTSKSHVVLAKNIKEASPPSRESTPEKNSSMDDLSFRRLSSESVDINERDSPETEKRISGLYYEAINKHNNKVCSGLPPKSPIKKTPTTPTTPPTPTINERDSQRESFKLPESFESSSSSSLSHTNSLSLQERRRLFMNEEKAKLEKKVEEIKYERKKSICEDISRKSSIKSETEQRDNDNTVILRKKSFASSVHSLNGNSLNNNSLNNGNNTTNNNNTTSVKDDATPELMKVFARRSLKIKDEDLDKMLINTVNNNNNLSNATQSLKKFTPTCSQPSVDSDKENQSASDEKLDKLPKLDLPQSITITKSNSSQTHTSTTTINGSSSLINNSNGNRNSLADFRLASNKTSNTALSPNNSNNNNHSSQGETTSINNSPKSFLPPIKIQPAFRSISIERSNNNSNNNNNPLSPTKTSCSTLERSTIKLGDLTTSSSTDSPIIMNKTIERSATMGEFKGIHQRRAEWEQRAKEALK